MGIFQPAIFVYQMEVGEEILLANSWKMCQCQKRPLWINRNCSRPFEKLSSSQWQQLQLSTPVQRSLQRSAVNTPILSITRTCIQGLAGFERLTEVNSMNHDLWKHWKIWLFWSKISQIIMTFIRLFILHNNCLKRLMMSPDMSDRNTYPWLLAGHKNDGMHLSIADAGAN